MTPDYIWYGDEYGFASTGIVAYIIEIKMQMRTSPGEQELWLIWRTMAN